jgi:hypothetical protein
MEAGVLDSIKAMERALANMSQRIIDSHVGSQLYKETVTRNS